MSPLLITTLQYINKPPLNTTGIIEWIHTLTSSVTVMTLANDGTDDKSSPCFCDGADSGLPFLWRPAVIHGHWDAFNTAESSSFLLGGQTPQLMARQTPLEIVVAEFSITTC